MNCLGFEYQYNDAFTYFDGQLVEAEFTNIVKVIQLISSINLIIKILIRTQGKYSQNGSRVDF